MFYVGALQAVNPEAKGFVWDFTWEIIGALVSAILEVAVRWTLRLVPPVLSESAAIYCVSALLAAIPASVRHRVPRLREPLYYKGSRAAPAANSK